MIAPLRARLALVAAFLVAGVATARDLRHEPIEFELAQEGRPLRLVGTVIRPDDAARHPVAVLSHGAWGPAERRREKPRLDLAPLSTWLAEHGFAVVVPMRRGYGASEGEVAESSGGCSDPDYARAGQAGADDILAAARWARAQDFADPQRLVLIGYSAGGWGSLAAASRAPDGLVALVNLAGGRGGFSASGWPCVWSRMLEAATGFARTTRVPSLWLYARNDALFGPEFAAKLAGAWRLGGAEAELHIVAPDYEDGHGVFMAAEGVPHWAPVLEPFLAAIGR
ncbi:MAG: alpha/beta fold hydrolase [Alphaproteobacteria bacterium]|nr:alpha/beta fold hydrolase [Alphaproteobacteria bacterium]